MNDICAKAQNFIKANGTDFQIAYCDYITGKAGKDNVCHELSKYQNEDGGFSNGLEIEYQGPISSPFTTAAALGYITRFQLSDTPLYKKTIKYLKDTQQADGKWDDCEKLNNYPHPPYMGMDVYTEYKTGMLLKWLIRLHTTEKEMVDKATEYMLSNFDSISLKNDLWSAIAYTGAFALMPQIPQYQKIMEWGMRILMPRNDVIEWQQISGMIEDDMPIPEASISFALKSLKDNQGADGGWPHPFGMYNRICSSIFILNFLKNKAMSI
jgi:hypothetical protein